MEEKNVTAEEIVETAATDNAIIEDATMEDAMKEIDKSMVRINTGDILEGKVVSVDTDSVIVNIGYHADGIILLNELTNKKDVAPADIVSPEDVINVEVLKLDDGEGNVLLSKKRADGLVAWDDIEQDHKDGKVIEVTVSEAVKGGVVADHNGIRAFIPASQLSDRYVEDISTFVGKKIRAEIIEFDQSKNKLVLSSRRLAKEESDAARQSVIENLKIGDVKTGTVIKLMPFGAFVDIGDVQGLLHNSDLSWTRIQHPSEVIKEGQEIEVTVIKIDKAAGKVGLGFKDMTLDPWTVNAEALKKGSIVDGVITRLVDFGAFVRIADSVEGLVHISQISENRIGKPSEVLEERQAVRVKIMDIDTKSKKISLSIKEVQNEFDAELVKQYAGSEDEGLGTIGDALGDAFKDLFN
ncbi:MAG TPA: 30S ribosomal protein S1 [Epulopiscium sp.]|nr:30S ribosomal protein S1 [Candidatus Epulonipiscium sp.]